jgi:hypothetical protein
MDEKTNPASYRETDGILGFLLAIRTLNHSIRHYRTSFYQVTARLAMYLSRTSLLYAAGL